MEPAHVLITGAAGQIGYVISHWIASGALYDERPVVLHLFDIPVAQNRLTALTMELQDCAFPTLAGVVATTEPEPAFKDVDCAFLVASVPLRKGQVRADLLKANAPIFKNTGEWLSQYSKPTCKVLVIGNPDNTNACIAAKYCKNIPHENFGSLSMLDHTRAVHEIATKLGVDKNDVKGVMVWGNHADSMVIDLSHATFTKDGKETRVEDVVGEEYSRVEFPKKIIQRGWDVLAYRGFSSAASPTNGSLMHMKAWLFGTKPGEILSLGTYVPKNAPYGIKSDIVCSLPCTVDKNGKIHIVDNLEINDWLRAKLDATVKDLIHERDVAFETLSE